ncbi:PREDICTED: uncharacterized protein LOC109183791 [Ipomoea nil]|uniref:uncharacterized protein LOC109183791 n=1 Tax=Ipomoea nil TaxID=35883 RepID=UPI000901BE6F|nr:PREDICTED: uncharacterized protein LOC109183791 [Ipomoea nil]
MMSMLLISQLQSEEGIKQVTGRLDQLSTHNTMLENQLANQASTSCTKVTGKLPACPENPREHVNAIVTRSGNVLGEPSLPIKTSTSNKSVDVEIEEKLEEEEVEPAVLTPKSQSHDEVEKLVRMYEPPLLPFPQKFQKQVKEKVPSHGKFLMDILAKKKKFGDHEMVAMAQEYRALARSENRSILKHRDLGRFTIPCFIGGHMIKRSLCDLGASVNVMPLSLCKKLNLGEPKPIQLTLTFADQSTTSPIGILEDVPVWVDTYCVPCDFIVIDASKNPDVPIILGRPGKSRS